MDATERNMGLSAGDGCISASLGSSTASLLPSPTVDPAASQWAGSSAPMPGSVRHARLYEIRRFADDIMRCADVTKTTPVDT